MGPEELAAAGLRRIRMERGLTQGDAGELLGVDASRVCRIERLGRSPLPASRIARAFGLRVEEVTALCPRCGYDPPAGFMCMRCGIAGGVAGEMLAASGLAGGEREVRL